MKRLIILMVSLALFSLANAQNTLSLNAASGHPGDTVTMTISLAGSDAVTAMQAFVPLGSQLSYVQGSATLGSRSNGHTLSATVLHDTLRIYSYSLALNSFTGNSGALLTFRVVLGNEPATYSLPLCSAMLSSAIGTSLSVQTTAGSVTILAPKISLTVGSVDYGHCPIRSTYTRSVAVRNIGNEPLTFTGVSFDDGTLSAGESSAYQIAAGGQRTVTVSYQPVTAGAVTLHGVFHSNARVGDSLLTVFADPYAVNELRPLPVSGYTDSIVTVQLRMNNMDSIVGLQTSIKLPEALTYIQGSFAVDSSRSQGHSATAGLMGDTLTLLITSLENRPLKGGDGVVATFQLQLHGYGYHTLSLLQTALSDTAGYNVLSSVYTGNLTIYSPTINCNSSLSMGNTSVTDTAEAVFTVRNTGNAPLVIERVQFAGTQSAQYFSVSELMPITVANNQNVALHVRYTGTVAGSYGATMQIYNNDPRATLKQVSVSGDRYEPNDLYFGSEGDQVGVMLDNYSAITALQMDVEYPYRYATMEGSDIHQTARSSSHFVSSARQNDSTWRILLLSMNNYPLVGNSGSVLNLQLHPIDTNDTGRYPMTMHNVMVANAAGANMLSSLDSTVYVATRQLWDTLYVHDTTILVEYIHDTTTIDHYIFDTVTLTDYVHDTTTVILWDTAYVDVFVHDTTLIDHYIFDTVTLTDYIHDTTYIDNYVHDTTYITDYVHDTTYITDYVHDTTIVVDTLWLTRYDTVYLHDTIYIHDTITVGVNNVDAVDAKVYVYNRQIVVEGADGKQVTLFDMNGRVLATKQGYYDKLTFDVPVSGGYLIKIGNHRAHKVVVIK